MPALTADSIARERRDGTLGLLFMTPLTAPEIVIGKVVSRVLLVFAIWLGALPILAICFICGGVAPQDVATLIMIHTACGMVALSAGLLASSLTQSRMTAFLFAFVLLGIFIQPIKVILDSFDALSQNWSAVRYNSLGYYLSGGPPAFPGYSSSHAAFAVLAEKNLIALLMLWASIRAAGCCVQRHWKDKPPSTRHLEFIKRYCTPLKQFSFRQKMRRTLESNPISWLQQYSWKARASKWGLCLLFVCIECFFVDGRDLDWFAVVLLSCLLLLVGACAFAGVNGFHYDKNSGALELILVTPLDVGKIIFGRARGLWKQFLPSTAVLVGSNIAFNCVTTGANSLWYRGTVSSLMAANYVLVSFEIIIIYLTLPVVATCMALRFRRIAGASILTGALAFAPMLLLFWHAWINAVRYKNSWYRAPDPEYTLLWLLTSPSVIVLAQAYATKVAYGRLRRAVENRRFAF